MRRKKGIPTKTGCQFKEFMKELYEETTLTPIRVAQMSGYLDWASQPSMFKHYPDFLFSYKYGENELLRVVELSRIISSTTQIGSKPYNQLNTPSAGNLHPVELYVQIRGIKGILSGIYHVDSGERKIVLIKEIEEDGIEQYVGLKKRFKGFIYLVSCVPFRSEWKYGLRAIRYVYLDLGHQIGSIKSSCELFSKETTILSDYDSPTLNEYMGFKGEEFISCVISSGELTESGTKELKQKLMYVAPTDYTESSTNITSIIAKNHTFKSQYDFKKCNLQEEHILDRRSARQYKEESMSTDKFRYLMDFLNAENYPLECYNIVLKESSTEAGVYLNNNLIKGGHFSKKMASLLVDQSFVKNAEIITVVCSKHFSANKLMLAGVFIHDLYMQAQTLNVACTGIGAFYDKKLQDFLQTDANILYVSAVGL